MSGGVMGAREEEIIVIRESGNASEEELQFK